MSEPFPADLVAYVRELALRDSKSLSQKALKCAEEQGELSRVVLALESAQGALHRVLPRERLLEEAVDVLLVALSIAHSEGWSDEEVREMVSRKADKWAARLAAEGRVSGVIPFEIHVSVPPRTDPEAFGQACAELGVKPLVLDLDEGDGRIRRDMMSSSVHRGTNASAMAELGRIARGLAGFGVVREKVETVPWHPKAPKAPGEAMPPGSYFEGHISVRVDNDLLDTASARWRSMGLHVSTNARKRGAEDSIVMLTLRRREGTESDFRADLRSVVLDVQEGPHALVEENAEFAVHDTDPWADERRAD